MITTFQRYEKKYLVEVSLMRKILPEIEKHMDPDKFCVGGNTYAISNLYYDTDTDDVIRDSLQKPFYKEKLRLRSYGIPKSGDTKVFLEIKKKVDKMVTKRRTRLTYAEAKRFMDSAIFPDTQDYMTRQVLKEVKYYLSHKKVHAATRISYDRLAYFDRADDSFRLTFDTNIRYLKSDIPGKAIDFQDSRTGKPILPSNLRLMEVKVSNAYPMWFTYLLSMEGIMPVSFSKYGVSYKTELLKKLEHASEYLDILSHI